MGRFEVTDAQTGEPVVVDEAEASAGLAQGRYTVSGQVEALTPEGRPVFIPAETIGQALAQGYRLDTAEQAAARADREEFRGRGAEAFAARTIGSATFGGSDVLARTLGGEEAGRTLRGLEEHNPEASLAGEVAGGVVPLLIPGGGLVRGATGAARAVEGGGIAARVLRGVTAPSRGVAALSEGAGALTARAVAAGEAGLGRRLLSRTLGGAVEGAVEGVAGEAGRLVTEEAIGYEPDLSGQAILARLGLGATLGGALGGTIGTAGGVGREGVDVLRRAFQGAEGVALHPAVARVASAMSGAPEESLRRVAGAEGRLVDDIVRRGDAVYEEGSARLRRVLDDLNVASAGQVGDYQIDADRILRDLPIRQRLGAAPQMQRIQHEAVDRLSADLRDAVERLRSPDLDLAGHGTSAAERLAGDLDLLAEQVRGARRGAPAAAAAAAAGPNATAAVPGRRRGAVDPLGATEVAAAARPGTVTAVNDVGRIIETELLSPDQLAAAYVGLDRIARRLEDSAGRAAGERATHGILTDLQDAVREVLEDDGIWGESIGSFRRELGQRARAYTAARTEAERFFFTNTDGILRADPSRIANFIQRSGKGGNRRAEEALTRFLNEQEAFNDFISRAGFSLDDSVRSRLARAPAAMSAARKVVEEAQEAATILNHWRRVERAGFMRGGFGGAAIAGAVGHFAGGPIGGLVAAAGAMLSNPAKIFRSLAAIRSLIQQVDGRIGESVRSLVRGTRVSATRVVVRSLQKTYDARIRQLDEQSDAPAFTRQLGEATADLSREAPQAQQQLQSAAVNAVMFLQERRPRSASPAGRLFARGTRNPPASEMDRFMRYARAVDTPMTVIDDIEAGRLSPEGVEVLRRVYPALYNHLLSRVVEEITEYGQEPSYSRRQQIALLMGVPTDYSMTPRFVSDMQTLYTSRNAAPESSSPAETDAPDMASNLATSTDELEANP